MRIERYVTKIIREVYCIHDKGSYKEKPVRMYETKDFMHKCPECGQIVYVKEVVT